MTPDGSRRVVVGVLTFRRTALLAGMLPELVAQAAASGDEVEVLVVDNDAGGSAAATVAVAARAAAAVGVTVRSVVEPIPGIVAGRNRALDEAAARHADALVFVDDDEQVAPGWLDALTAEWRRADADAVVGPTIWPDDLDLPPWVEGSGYFRRRVRRPTGTPVRSFPTSNVLLDLATLRRLGLRFDPRFSATGGEDTVLSMSLVAAGGRVVWCDEAVAVEHVPPERRTRAFVLRRVRRRAGTWVQASVLVTPPSARARRRLTLAGHAGARALRASAGWVLGVVRRDLARRARAERALAVAAGMVAGLAGHRHDEYGARHDPPGRPTG